MSRSSMLVILLFGILLSACASAIAKEAAPAEINNPISAAANEPQVEVLALRDNISPSATPSEKSDSSSSALTHSALYVSALEASTLVVEGGGESEPLLYPLDPEGGEALSGYEQLPLGRHYAYAFSPDGQTLSLVTFLSSEFTRPHALVFLNLETWQTEEFDLEIDSYVRDMLYSPDGRRLVIHFGEVKSIVMVFDLDRGMVTEEVTLDFLATRIRYTQDGQDLMLYGTAIENRFTAQERTVEEPVIVLLDGGDLSLRWQDTLEGVRDGVFLKDENAQAEADMHQPGVARYYSPGLAFAPFQDVLYVVHHDSERLTRVDFSAQQIEMVEIRTKLTWLEQLLTMGGSVAHAKIAEGSRRQAAISPDGQLLYVVGDENELYKDESGSWQVRSIPLGLQVVRLSDSVRTAQVETQAVQVSISGDGRKLYLQGWDEQAPWTEVFSTATLQFTDRLDGMQLSPGYRMNGEGLLLSSEWIEGRGYRVAVVDPQTLKVIHEWMQSRPLVWLSAR